MSNLTPAKPSFVFGYWRPWKENSNLFDSYLDYTRDTSLVKYGADTVGKFINQASKEQVKAINQLGQAIGRGMNVLSNQMADISETLVFLNRNMDVQIEQQKLSNLLLQNIAALLRVPESEKARQHSIELGIKFFVNASKDSDLYTDALAEFLKAENLMKQDYFVLYRIGCIYLYADNYINPEKALDYFLRAAKYAMVETNKEAIRSYNVLALNSDNQKIKKIEAELKAYLDKFDYDDYPKLSESSFGGWAYEEFTYELYTVPDYIDDEYNCNEDDKIYFQSLIDDQTTSDDLRNELLTISRTVKNILNKYGFITNNISSIHSISVDAYQKAAFASYILGRFSDAVNYQSRALDIDSNPQIRFQLAKYQVRNGDILEGIKNLSQCIEEEPVFALASFKEIDLINEPEVLKLISSKNAKIDNDINKLLNKWKDVFSTKKSTVIEELALLTEKSYEIKVSQFKSFEKQANDIFKNIATTGSKIDSFISEIKETTFCTYDAVTIKSIIERLQKAKDLPFEKMIEVLNNTKTQLDADKVKIGSRFAGGIVFFIDKSGNHGLVCADEDFGKTVWGRDGLIGASKDGIANGAGIYNTKKIVESASWHKGIFNISKKPFATAARLCLESNYKGFSDWWLPTPMELRLMYENLEEKGLGNFKSAVSDDYWSSLELDAIVAVYFSFYSGSNNYNYSSKDDTKYVRAVRAF